MKHPILFWIMLAAVIFLSFTWGGSAGGVASIAGMLAVAIGVVIFG